MKKFSNLDKIETITEVKKTEIDLKIEKLINECLIISINGENNIDTNIIGKEQLIEQIKKIIFEENQKNESYIINQIKQESITNLDLNKICESIDQYKKVYESYNESPSPMDIFNSEDYDQVNNTTILLKSLNDIPQDLSPYINENSIKNYFEKENKIQIVNNNSGWNIKFIPSERYIKDISGSKLENYNWFKFQLENDSFINSFTEACRDITKIN